MEESCELCGRKTELIDAIVEGSMLSVCKNCAKFGNVIEIQKPRLTERPTERMILDLQEENEEYIVDDYAQKIKSARERLNLKQEQLALRIAERESVIHKIESGNMIPTIHLARKLGKFLNIELINPYKEPEKAKMDLKDKEITIGDLIKLKRYKK